MKKHFIHLHPEPFSLVKSGKKIIEARLYDEKRKKFTIGDQLVFENRGDGEKLLSTITNLYTYKTFSELYNNHEPHVFGDSNKEELLNSVLQFYSKNDEQKYGVVGIEFKVEEPNTQPDY